MAETSVPPTPSTPSISKGRKGSAAGGGKAWTEAEEIYLLEMRLQKLPYKKIASHLDKTELACRLHFHQLSHGGNRRKRTSSISSNSSEKSLAGVGLEASSVPPTPATGKPRSTSPRLSPLSSTGAIQKPGASSPQKLRGKPLLPKPSSTSSAQSGNGSGAFSSSQRGPKKSASNKAAAKHLRVNCSAAAGGASGDIDRRRLQKIVEKQEAAFWAAVAQEYGGNYTPNYLKKIWHDGRESGPPTPAISPASKTEEEVEEALSKALAANAAAMPRQERQVEGSEGICEIPELPEEMELGEKDAPGIVDLKQELTEEVGPVAELPSEQGRVEV